MIERIEFQGKCFALVLRNEFEEEGVHFFTSNDNPFQLGIHVHKQGTVLKPHIHANLPKTIESIQEMLHVERGTVEVDFYSEQGTSLGSTNLHMGDTILLLHGGHGFRILENSKIVEVKQGPYEGVEADKRFLGT